MKARVTIELEFEDDNFDESFFVDITAEVQLFKRGYDERDFEMEYYVSYPSWDEKEYTNKENIAIEKYIDRHIEELEDLFIEKFERDETN